MVDNSGEVEDDPNGQEHEEGEATKHVQEPQVGDVGVVQDLLAENILQAEATGGDQRAQQTHHIKR